MTSRSRIHVSSLTKSLRSRASFRNVIRPISSTRLCFCTHRIQPTSASRMLFTQRRSLSSSSNDTPIAERDYHKLSDTYLENLVSELEDLGDELDLKDFDVTFASGVLTLSLGHLGTYVINKQPPNKQIWLSSPISGPKRYDYLNEQWVYHRDHETLESLLNRELSTLLKREISLSPSSIDS